MSNRPKSGNPVRRQALGNLAAWSFRLAQKRFMVRDIALCERRGQRLGRLLYRVDKKHRERTISNLRMVYPELGEAEVVAMSRRVYEHFGLITADFLRSPIRPVDEVMSNMEWPEAIPQRHAELIEYGKGMIYATCHLGNWERFAQWATGMQVDLAVVARDPDASALSGIILEMRERTGVQVLSQGTAARKILTRLRNNQAIALLPDQNDDECFVPFFGYPAGTVLGPGVLQLRTGAPIVPACCVRIGVGRYRSLIGETIWPEEGQTAEQVMAKVNLGIEALVRQYPDQYLWMHDRWKSARRRGLLS
jgi:KDO2-lipid IV(A) lauroyltransferase